MDTHTQTKKRFVLFALLFGALALSGCGARKTARYTGSNEFGSRTTLGEGAFCNSFSSRTTQLDGKIQSYRLPGGEESGDMMRIRITGIPSSFETNSKYVIRMFRMKAYSDNTSYLDDAPVNMSVETSSHLLVSGYMTELSTIDIATIRKNALLGGTTATDFFQKVDIVVTDVDYSWDALKIALQEKVADDEYVTIGEADMLMPVFTADPNLYATDHPPILQALHPFWADRASATMNFADLSDSFCW